MNSLISRLGRPLLWMVTLLLMAGLFHVSRGLYNIDEFIYLMSVEAMSDRHAFTILNGYETFGSDSLKLWFLVDGPRGLVPQYPAGLALAGAPLYALAGVKGVMLLNTLAAAATLWLTRRLACLLCESEGVATLAALLFAGGTFWLDYAYGVWPHALSSFFVLTSLVCVGEALRHERDASAWMMRAGLAAGVGLLFRVDGVLLLPALGMWLLVRARHPWRSSGALALGLLPGAGLASLINQVKFGVPNPLFYGRYDKGGIDPSSYLGMLVLVGAAVALLVMGRLSGWRPWRNRGVLALGGALLLITCAVTPLGAVAWRCLAGAYALLVDVRALETLGPAGTRSSQGVVSFFGVPKAALAQGMPWLGVVPALLVGLRHASVRPAVMFIVLVCGVWVLPFAARAWHGGLGSNMRYLLPLLPLLAILGAQAWHDLMVRVTRPMLMRLTVYGGAAGWLIGTSWELWYASGPGGAQQTLGTAMFYVIAIVSMFAAWQGAKDTMAARGALFAVAMGVGAASVFAYQDFMVTQSRRDFMSQSSDRLKLMPRPSLVVGYPDPLASHIGQADRLISVPDRLTGRIDPILLDRALTAGYRVFAQGGILPQIQRQAPHLRVRTVDACCQGGDLFELVTQPDSVRRGGDGPG